MKELYIMLGDKNAVANIAVKNLDTAGKFYQDTLGLTKIKAESDAIVFRSGESLLNVYRSDYAGTNKATAVTWAVGAQLENIVRALTAKGVKFEHCDLPATRRENDVHIAGDMKVAWFKDPDGNILNIVNY